MILIFLACLSKISIYCLISFSDNFKIPLFFIVAASEILEYANGYELIGIDQAQFFDDELVSVCNKLADRGARVVVAGLDMDFKGKPFGPIPNLFSVAEFITKVHAICMRCGNIAQYSHRLSDKDELVVIGEKDIYEPLCRTCYNEQRNQNQSRVCSPISRLYFMY